MHKNCLSPMAKKTGKENRRGEVVRSRVRVRVGLGLGLGLGLELGLGLGLGLGYFRLGCVL